MLISSFNARLVRANFVWPSKWMEWSGPRQPVASFQGSGADCDMQPIMKAIRLKNSESETPARNECGQPAVKRLPAGNRFKSKLRRSDLFVATPQQPIFPSSVRSGICQSVYVSRTRYRPEWGLWWCGLRFYKDGAPDGAGDLCSIRFSDGSGAAPTPRLYSPPYR